MTGAERRAWLLVGSLFATRFLVFGSGYNAAGVFFTPLLDHFGWTRAQLSLLQTTLALAAGLVVPPLGGLLDPLEGPGLVGPRAAGPGDRVLPPRPPPPVHPPGPAPPPVRPRLR